jgi:predicted nucleic acid-binding protein
MGPWRRLNLSPEWEDIAQLSEKWNLRGADLWHLATAKSIQREIPELCLLTLDERLRKAAAGEGLIP